MKFLFLGAGAIGTYVGGSLAAAGDEVTFIERPETAAVIAEHGLKVQRSALAATWPRIGALRWP